MQSWVGTWTTLSHWHVTQRHNAHTGSYNKNRVAQNRYKNINGSIRWFTSRRSGEKIRTTSPRPSTSTHRLRLRAHSSSIPNTRRRDARRHHLHRENIKIASAFRADLLLCANLLLLLLLQLALRPRCFQPCQCGRVALDEAEREGRGSRKSDSAANQGTTRPERSARRAQAGAHQAEEHEQKKARHTERPRV